MIPRLVLDAKPKTLPVTAHNSAHHTVRAAIACCRLAQGSKRSLQGRFWRRSTYPREISQEFPRPSKPEDAFPEADQEEETAIHDLLYWLVQNGVTGIGLEESNVAIFEVEGGERGVVALKELKKGDTIITVPLRLSFTDVDSKAEGPASNLPWPVRLAGRILGEYYTPQSPWRPYLHVLPHAGSPCPFLPSLEDINASPVPLGELLPLLPQLLLSGRRFLDRATASFHESTSPNELAWALQLVQSRTFGAAGKRRELVRMLVPLVDFFNHRGDESAGPLGQSIFAGENARWDVVQQDGAWMMRVSATKDIGPEEEVFFSYCERPNEGFLVQYGFTPTQNPHDSVTLFETPEQAANWYIPKLPPELASRAADIGDAMLKAANDLADPRQGPPDPLDPWDSGRGSALQLRAGSQMDARVMAVLNCLATDMEVFADETGKAPAPPEEQDAASKGLLPTAKHMLGLRCWALLHTPDLTDLEQDLGLLVADANSSELDAELHARIMQRYTEVIRKVVAGAPADAQRNREELRPDFKSPLVDGALSDLDRNLLKLVAYKKMILWDALETLQTAS